MFKDCWNRLGNYIILIFLTILTFMILLFCTIKINDIWRAIGAMWIIIVAIIFRQILKKEGKEYE